MKQPKWWQVQSPIEKEKFEKKSNLDRFTKALDNFEQLMADFEKKVTQSSQSDKKES